MSSSSSTESSSHDKIVDQYNNHSYQQNENEIQKKTKNIKSPQKKSSLRSIEKRLSSLQLDTATLAKRKHNLKLRSRPKVQIKNESISSKKQNLLIKIIIYYHFMSQIFYN
eukprot:gb/GECH01007052.1/.p1 GENE.gb/GECH01007052.1/~~gb/GECH01007052.1/.p1  ORF type:complete len:111 (+),score=29.77 gb/GECH01007052.1/:1-333(+)